MGKEKKEIWKLRKLYRAYLTDDIKRDMYVNWADKECIDMFYADEVEEEDLYKFLNQLSVLKKFVKWLVWDDKINIEKVENKANFEFTCNYIYKKDEIEDKLLMLLSISSTPIEDLLLYLK